MTEKLTAEELTEWLRENFFDMRETWGAVALFRREGHDKVNLDGSPFSLTGLSGKLNDPNAPSESERRRRILESKRNLLDQFERNRKLEDSRIAIEREKRRIEREKAEKEAGKTEEKP